METGNRSSIVLYYAAATTTAIAGILHLILVPNIISRNPNSGIFFIISGIAQIFWVIPMLKRWGRMWYYIGMGDYKNSRKSHHRKRGTHK